MTYGLMSRFWSLCGVASAAVVLLVPAVHAQVAPVPYLNLAGPFGYGSNIETQYFGGAPDEDGFRKGFSVRSFSMPVSAFGSTLGGVSSFSGGGLTSTGAQYGYSFKGVGDMPVTLFGGVNALRTNPDVFTSLVTPGFERTNTLATSVNAGVEFKPTSNVSLSFSAGYVQPSGAYDSDIRSRLLPGETPIFARPR